MLVVVLALLLLTAAWFLINVSSRQVSAIQAFGAVLTFVATMILTKGFFTLQPNEASVLLMFGNYRGTERNPGFHWTNPFYTKRKISLRAHNLNSERLKVNDKRGNPIEIGAVVVWRVEDTAQALFDVENYTSYITIQSESALRHLASSYSYDHGDGTTEGEVNLRSGGDEVAQALQAELQERLRKAGVRVEEARIAHLAYAPEIAQAMLRVQQAEAVIAARTKIVQGAVSMVEMALQELAAKQVVSFDDERRAAMVSNLLVVLCGESEASPVINTGTLYH
jgi:regulator of protease activity HflC (stomatin/prohibitin superfamily)